jgi:hypothetical protein
MTKTEVAMKVVGWLQQAANLEQERALFTAEFAYDLRGEPRDFDAFVELAARPSPGPTPTPTLLSSVEGPDAVALLFDSIDDVTGLSYRNSWFFRFQGDLIASLAEVTMQLPARAPDPVRPDELTADAIRAAQGGSGRPTGTLSFDEALTRARAIHDAVILDRIRDGGHYWVFRVRQIGCRGIVVDKRSGLATALGSQWDLDTWLWGYDKGLVTGKHGVAFDLTVTKVVDYERAVALLKKLRISPPEGRRAALQRLPRTFARAVDWRATQRLKNETGGVFEWSIRRSDEPAAP